LLEAVVYSHRAAQQLDAELAGTGPVLHDVTVAERTLAADAGWSDLRVRLRELMWEDAGISRADERLQRAAEGIRALRAQIETRFVERGVSPEAVETRNLADTASLVVQCALMRRESRGLHYNIDYPFRDNELYLNDTVVRQERF
jgi:L-aspartate oxidase